MVTNKKVTIFSKKAFTMVELILTVSVIGILIMGTTVYLGGAGDRRKIIEAQGCANTIGGEIDNFVFYALTSKELKFEGNSSSAPDNYRIGMGGGNSNSDNNCTRGSYKSDSTDFYYCDELIFYGENNNTESKNLNYKTITARNTCSQTNQNLRYLRNTNSEDDSVQYININKGFTQTLKSDGRVFYLQGADNNKYITGSIMIILCLDNDCKSRKEIGKRDVDGRTQTVSLNKCRFYDEEDTSKCKEREYEEKTENVAG